jgi:hypothetical protein
VKALNRRWIRPVFAFATLLGGMSGCDAAGAPLVAGPTPKPLHQMFGPDYPAARPGGELKRIDDATISDDGLVLAVEFVGGPGYTPSDPCSTDYEPWVAADGDVLQVAITELTHPEQATLPPNAVCTAAGHRYVFDLRLSAPFLGSTIQDPVGNTLWVRDPLGLVMPKVLPPGWQLRLSEDVPEARPPLWARVYAPAAATIEAPNRGAGQLDLYQAFGAATVIGGGPDRQELVVNGDPAVLLRDSGLGELLLQWVIAGDGVALVANQADLTVQQLLEIAEGVEPAK